MRCKLWLLLGTGVREMVDRQRISPLDTVRPFFTAAQYSPKLRSQKYRCSHHLGAPRNEWNLTVSPRHGLDFLHGQQHLLQRILINRLGHNTQKVLHLPDGRIRAEI